MGGVLPEFSVKGGPYASAKATYLEYRCHRKVGAKELGPGQGDGRLIGAQGDCAGDVRLAGECMDPVSIAVPMLLLCGKQCRG